MKLLDRYIFSEWIKVFVMTLLVTVGILIIADIQDKLSDFTNNKAPVEQIIMYFLIRIPAFLPTIFPIALLISILFSLGSLHKNNEIIAFQTAGLTVNRITRVLWISGMTLASLLFYLNAKVVPWSVEKSRLIENDIEFASEVRKKQEDTNVGIINNLGFRNSKDNRLWIMNRFSQYSYRAFGITVYSLNKEGHEIRRIMAREAKYDDIRKHWTFLDGRELVFSPDGKEMTADRSVPFKELKVQEFSEDPNVMILQSKRPSALSIFEIENIIDSSAGSSDTKLNSYKVYYHRILSTPFVCLVVLAITIPFAITGVRTNPLVGVSKSMGLFAIYYLLASLCDILGERNLLSPLIAAWIPNVTMFFFGVSLYRKMR